MSRARGSPNNLCSLRRQSPRALQQWQVIITYRYSNSPLKSPSKFVSFSPHLEDGSGAHKKEISSPLGLSTVTYLDIPDLSALVSVSHHFLPFSMDPILHRERLLTVAPARLSHFLVSPCRPLFDDLVNRNIAPGLDLLRRWRQGNYLHSPEVRRAVDLFERYIHMTLNKFSAVRKTISRFPCPPPESGKKQTFVIPHFGQTAQDRPRQASRQPRQR